MKDKQQLRDDNNRLYSEHKMLVKRIYDIIDVARHFIGGAIVGLILGFITALNLFLLWYYNDLILKWIMTL